MDQSLTTFVTAALPPLSALGEPAPITGSELMELVKATTAAPLVETILLWGDLMVQQSLAAGVAAEELPLAVMTEAQARGEEDLPQHLSEVPTEGYRPPADAVWAAQLRSAAAVALEHNSAFLCRLIGFEVALRNETDRLRAEKLGVDPIDALFDEDLVCLDASDAGYVDDAVAGLKNAADPMAAQRAFDEIRWLWLEDHAAAYSFTDDELAVYATRLLLVTRWHRVASAAPTEA